MITIEKDTMRLQWSVGKEMTPETAVKKSIRDYLKLSGWFTFSIMQGLGSYRGIADIYAIKNGNGLWIEVKAGKGKTTLLQERELKLIMEAGGVPVVINEKNLDLLRGMIKLIRIGDAPKRGWFL